MSNMQRRRYERAPFFVDVSLRALPKGTVSPGRSIDLSLGGVGLVTGAVFTPGQEVSIVFHLPGTGPRKRIDVEVTGRVVNLNADVDANRIGVEFLEPLGPSRGPELVERLQNMN